MHEVTFEEGLELIRAKDARYHRDAYIFVREALEHTQDASNKAELKSSRSAKSPRPSESQKHVSGQQLLEGIRQCALTQFGPMAITVFEEWGVRHCRDFGEIVFNMVEFRLLRKTDNDSLNDFEAGYDFYEAFQKPFLPGEKIKTTSKPAAK